MKTSSLPIACCFVLLSASLMGAAFSAQSRAEAAVPGLECGGEPCDAVARGFVAFFDRRPVGQDGNRRSCADCHMANDAFQLSPAQVEARFQALQWERQRNPQADDPLFRSIDADDFRTNGANAEDYTNLRQNALVRIVFPLPANIRLIDPETNLASSEAVVDVWRMVPTVNDVALTGPGNANPWPRGPNHFGGYQLDARMGSLQQQALGALISHAEITEPPPSGLLDDLTAFQRALFTNERVRALADALSAGTAPLPDPDPPLDALEERGKAVFERACAQCHGGPSQTTAQPPIGRFHDILTQCPRPVDTAVPPRFVFAPCSPSLARNARTYEITLPSGTTLRRTSSDPGRALLTGFVGGAPPTDDWNKFDVPGLRGIGRTAPYFHNNSAASLAEIVDHYIQFFNRVKANAAPGVVPPVATTDGIHFDRQPRPDEREALLAYLRKL